MSQRHELWKRWKEADSAVSEFVSGAQSATISDGSNSQSYTRASLSDLRKIRDGYAKAIAEIDRRGRAPIKFVGVRFQA